MTCGGHAGDGDDGRVLFLSTLGFPGEWLDELRSVSPRLQVVQQVCQTAAEVPADVWREVRILHTGQVLPRPAQAPRLSWVQLDTSGVDHVVDQPIWRETAVPVTTIGGVSARWTAEYVVMMLLAFSHRLPRMLDFQRQHDWPDPAGRWGVFMPSPLAGARVAIIGFGRIGRAAGALCAALGMDVVGVRRGRPVAGGHAGGSAAAPEAIGPEFPRGTVTEMPAESLRDVLRGADFVVVTVPLTAQTRGLLDRAAVESMKPGAVLVNVSRGGVVDEQAVAALLSDGRLAGAAFDVLGKEPLPGDDSFWDTRNLIISPHVAGFAGDYAERVKALVMENLRRFLAGEALLNQADRRWGY